MMYRWNLTSLWRSAVNRPDNDRLKSASLMPDHGASNNTLIDTPIAQETSTGRKRAESDQGKRSAEVQRQMVEKWDAGNNYGKNPHGSGCEKSVQAALGSLYSSL